MPRKAIRPMQRRTLLKATGAVGIGALAGCTSGVDDEDPAEDLPEVELYDSEGERVAPRLIYDSGDTTAEQIATEVQDNLASIGVDLEIEPRPEVLGQDFASEPLPDANPDEFEWGPIGRNGGPPEKTRTVYDWDILHGIGANSYPRTPGNTETFWQKDSSVNAYGYVPEADISGLYETFRSETDQGAKQEALNDIMGALTEELPANFMSQGLYFYGFSDDINTGDDFNLYGGDMGTVERYRDEQTVNGDYIRLSGTPFSQALLPEQDDQNSAYRTDLLMDGSFAINPDDEIVPLHIDIEDSGDSQVWVCTLRDNLMFGEDADGNSYGQMTAEDWVFQLENVHAVGYDSPDDIDLWEDLPPSEAVGSYEPVENVEQTGELEFQLELSSPDALFPYRPIIWGEQVLPKELYEQYAPDVEALRQSEEVQQFTYTGNLGPYTFENREEGAAGSFTAVRNDEYYLREQVEDSNVQTMDGAFADAPYFETYQFDVEPEQSTRAERFRAGDGDRMELPTDLISEFEESVDSVRVEDQQDPYISFLFFNQRSNGNVICKERDGREAMARVINKSTITEQIQQGYSEPAVTHQPTWSNWYDESAVNKLGVDITEDEITAARDLLRDNDTFSLEEV